MVGLLGPIDYNFISLKQLVANALQTTKSLSDLTLQYQVDPGLPPTKLDNDNAVEFYVELKKQDSTLTRFPLYITINEESICEPHVSTTQYKEHVPSCEIANLGSNSEDGSNDYIDKQELPSYIEYVDKFVDFILADVDRGEKKLRL